MISVHRGLLLVGSLNHRLTCGVWLVIEQIDLGVSKDGISLSHLLSTIFCSCLILDNILMVEGQFAFSLIGQVGDHRFAGLYARTFTQELSRDQTYLALACLFYNWAMFNPVELLLFKVLLGLYFGDSGLRFRALSIFDLFHLRILLVNVMNCLFFLLELVIGLLKIHLGLLLAFLRRGLIVCLAIIHNSSKSDLRLILTTTFFMVEDLRTTCFRCIWSRVTSQWRCDLCLTLVMISFLLHHICKFFCLISWAISIATVQYFISFARDRRNKGKIILNSQSKALLRSIECASLAMLSWYNWGLFMVRRPGIIP